MHLRVLDDHTACNLTTHRAAWNLCTKCTIGYIAHHHVFARGTLPCDILFVGLGPGVTEDLTGWPFVGRAGRLLDAWVEQALTPVGLSYACANLVLCRPTDKVGGKNRDPRPKEAFNCAPRLREFVLQIARPRAIISLGRTTEGFLPDDLCETKLALKHPAWVLRCGGGGCSEDVEIVRELKEFAQEIANAKASSNA